MRALEVEENGTERRQEVDRLTWILIRVYTCEERKPYALQMHGSTSSAPYMFSLTDRHRSSKPLGRLCECMLFIMIHNPLIVPEPKYRPFDQPRQ